jgi:thiopeptide-type bacteriocin biosynthesis protein
VKRDELKPVGFFLLRAAALPFATLDTWCETPELLRELVARADVRAAIALASPSFAARIEAWLRGELGRDEALKVERSCARYLQRMCSRTTPFGAFAGVALGEVGERTKLALGVLRQHLALDGNLVARLARTLAPSEPRLRLADHIVADRDHVTVVAVDDEGRHRARRLARTPAVEIVLAAARDWTTRSALIDRIADHAARPAELVASLQASGLLVGGLVPPLVGPPPVDHWIAELGPTPELTALRGALATGEPARVEQTVAAIDGEPVVHVTSSFAGSALELAPALAREALHGVRALAALAPARPDRLGAFARAFAERYGERTVPLLEALDPELGIGFEPEASTLAPRPPLLAGMALPPAPIAERWGARERWLAARVADAARTGSLELAIHDHELPFTDLPRGGSVTITLHGDRVHVKRVIGPSGLAMLGRFALVLPELEERARALARHEAEQTPDAIVAEIVHLPHPSSRNVMTRPALRDREICVLGGTAPDPSRQVPLAELTVAIANKRVTLAWRGTRVLPRLSISDNAGLPGLPAYRFLAALATDPVLAWDWGPLADVAVLPRVVYGKAILALARWRLDPATLAILGGSDESARDAKLAELRLPRWTMVCRRDLNLSIDWANPASIAAALSGETELVVEEMFPGPERTFASSAAGDHVCELVVPFARPAPRIPAPPQITRRGVRRDRRWTYAKLYCPEAAADAVLREVVAPLVLEHPGVPWFFLRYDDPGFHLRLRFRDPGMRAELEARADGSTRTSRIDFATYEPELERYGGEAAMPVVERMFHRDSEAALAIALQYGAHSDARWQLALRGMASAFALMIPELEARCRVIEATIDRYAADFGLIGAAGRVLGQRYRECKPAIRAALDEPTEALKFGYAALAQRDRYWSELVGELPVAPRERLAVSLAHVHANRVLATDQRLHEALLCKFLARETRTALTVRMRG